MVEGRLRAAGRRAFAAWQLFGNGSVGSQTILGIPRIDQLRGRTDLRGVVWPFETGLCCPERAAGTDIVYVEIWPGCIHVERGLHAVRDAAQMLSYVRWAALRDVAGDLDKAFEILGLTQGDRATVAQHEGWILGFEP